MSQEVFVIVFTGLCALATLAGTIFTAIRSGKDAKDRAADREVASATADRLEAEREEISERTRASIFKDVKEELKDAKGELAQAKLDLRAAWAEVDSQRALLAQKDQEMRQLLAQKDNEINQMREEMQRAMRRAAALEKWIDANAARLGTDGLPPDSYYQFGDDNA